MTTNVMGERYTGNTGLQVGRGNEGTDENKTRRGSVVQYLDLKHGLASSKHAIKARFETQSR